MPAPRDTVLMLMTDGLIISATAANDTVGNGICTGTMGTGIWDDAAGPGVGFTWPVVRTPGATPNVASPTRSDMPYFVTIRRAISVARSRSLCAPVETSL